MGKNGLLHNNYTLKQDRRRIICRSTLLLFVFIMTLSLAAQTERNNDSVPSYRENKLPTLPQKSTPVNSDLQKYMNSQPEAIGGPTSTLNDDKLVPTTIHYDFTKEKLKPKETEPSSTNPFNGNFATGGYMVLDRNSYLSGSYSYSALPIIGSVRETNLFYNRSLGSHLNFSGGVYGAKMMMVGLTPQGAFNDFGFKGMLEWKINDNIAIHGFGTYSLNKPRYSLAMNPYVENTKYGATMQIMFTKNIGLEGGVVREFNPFTGRWKTYPVIYPILKFGE